MLGEARGKPLAAELVDGHMCRPVPGVLCVVGRSGTVPLRINRRRAAAWLAEDRQHVPKIKLDGTAVCAWIGRREAASGKALLRVFSAYVIAVSLIYVDQSDENFGDAD